jgi:hypothetical protein
MFDMEFTLIIQPFTVALKPFHSSNIGACPSYQNKSGARCRAGLRYGSSEDLPFLQLSSLFSDDAGPWTTVRLDTEYPFIFFFFQGLAN